MNEKQKKRNKIIGISIGILVVLLVVISSTYAYWQITRSQEDPNQIVAACLDFDVNFPVGITEENKWPMSGTEAMSSIDGYTFTVTNNCPEDVTYVIGLESVTSEGITDYLQDSSVGIGFDGVNKGTYASLTDLEGPTANARGSKKLQTAIVKGKSDVEGENVNTHNLKLWIDETSDAEEQSKGFSAKLFITGGQKVPHDLPNPLTAESCFEMDTETGTEIIGYDESCGDSVVIPSTVNGVAVKTIDSDAFKSITYNYDYGIVATSDGPVSVIVYNMDEYDNLVLWAKRNGMESLPISTEEPELLEGQFIQYCEDPIDGEMPTCHNTDGLTLVEKKVEITGLDLSQAYNLELIEAVAFSNYKLETSSNSTESFFSQYENQTISLTSLIFGKNRELKLGFGAFNGIDVDNLIVYSNMDAEYDIADEEVHLFDSVVNYMGYIYGYFAGSTINNLTIEYADGYESIDDRLYALVNSNNITIEEGITTIGAGEFLGSNSPSVYGNNVTIPNSINTIGELAFYNWPSTSTINVMRIKDDFLTNVLAPIDTYKWYGDAQVIDCNGVLIYE